MQLISKTPAKKANFVKQLICDPIICAHICLCSSGFHCYFVILSVKWAERGIFQSQACIDNIGYLHTSNINRMPYKAWYNRMIPYKAVFCGGDVVICAIYKLLWGKDSWFTFSDTNWHGYSSELSAPRMVYDFKKWKQLTEHQALYFCIRFQEAAVSVVSQCLETLTKWLRENKLEIDKAKVMLFDLEKLMLQNWCCLLWMGWMVLLQTLWNIWGHASRHHFVAVEEG